jgi:hypothetical protein
VRVIDKVAWIPGTKRPSTFTVRALSDSVLDDGREHRRKQRDNVKPHH